MTGYQGYVRKLAHVAAAQSAGPTGRGQSLADVAVTCACTLLNTVPHFNFRGDLLKILVRKLSRRTVDRSFVQCRSALQTLFREDEEGRPSMEAVSLLTKMMKTRQFKIDESVVNLFLHLRLLSEFLGRASGDSVTRENEDVAPRKKDREFRTKREKKRVKEDRAVAKVMEQADALVSHEERDHMQSETLKLVFATYFRILKLRTPHLMGAVLEGLQKYSHLINQDYFGDLLEALKDLIRGSQQPGGQLGDERNKGTEEDHLEVIRDTNREILLCTATAFALLAGQDAHNARGNLHLDLSFFTQNLYQSLLPLSISPDVEVGARSLPRRDSGDSSPDSKMDIKVNLETTTALLMRCLLGVLLPQWNSRSVPPLRIAAFTKQLMTASLHVPEKSSQAIVGLLQDVAHSHGKKITALWNTEERRGDGSWNPLSQTVEASNVYSSTVFEGELLKRHYCPKVREGVRQLEKSLSSI